MPGRWRWATVAAVVALVAAGCGSSSEASAVRGGPPAGHGSPAAALVGFLDNVATRSPAVCDFVEPSFAGVCRANVSALVLDLPHGPVLIGRTAISGDQALVVVVGTTCLQLGNTGSGSTGHGSTGSGGSGAPRSTTSNDGTSPTSATGGRGGGSSAAAAILAKTITSSSGNTNCVVNADPARGLPSPSTDFAAAFRASTTSSTDPAGACIRVNGKWYVDLTGALPGIA